MFTGSYKINTVNNQKLYKSDTVNDKFTQEKFCGSLDFIIM